jgi:hypothetical protein
VVAELLELVLMALQVVQVVALGLQKQVVLALQDKVMQEALAQQIA